jgi:hypothetical protein
VLLNNVLLITLLLIKLLFTKCCLYRPSIFTKSCRALRHKGHLVLWALIRLINVIFIVKSILVCAFYPDMWTPRHVNSQRPMKLNPWMMNEWNNDWDMIGEPGPINRFLLCMIFKQIRLAWFKKTFWYVLSVWRERGIATYYSNTKTKHQHVLHNSSSIVVD